MKYLQIIFHIDAISVDDIRKEIWFEIPWMSQEAKRVSFDGHNWCQHIRSASYPDISVRDLFLLGDDEERHESYDRLHLETAQVLPWMGVTLENLLYWDRRCHRSNKIYTREKEDRKSILFIDNEPIEFNSKTQEKLIHLFLTGANHHLRDMFNRA
jgi:hypothetical protein